MSAPGTNPQAPPVPYKSEGTTAVLAVVLGLLGFNGIGHIYVGKIVYGIVICIGSILLFYVGIIGLFFSSLATASMGFYGAGLGMYFGGAIAIIIAFIALFILQIVHSLKLCKKYNEHLRQHGTAPW